jgi:probable rRNA maturation factor
VKEQVITYKLTEIYLQDTQRADYFKLRNIKKILCEFLYAFESYLKKSDLYLGHAELISINLIFCGARKIRSLNREYRNKDKKTDVLSFPLVDSYRVKPDFYTPIVDLGDIYICREVAQSQAKSYGLSLEEEVMRQLIHGTLHLLGYDHEVSPKEEKVMFSIEEQIFNKAGKRLGWPKYEREQSYEC